MGIGFTLNLIFSIINGEYYPGVPSFLEKYDSTLMAVTVQTLIYMLLGIIQAFSTDIMNNQRRSLLSKYNYPLFYNFLTFASGSIYIALG